MQANMIAPRQQFKIFWAVVVSITIAMVNDFISAKIAPQKSFKNKAMHVFTVFAPVAHSKIWTAFRRAGSIQRAFSCSGLSAFQPDAIVTTAHSSGARRSGHESTTGNGAWFHDFMLSQLRFLW